jgi:hypothetical protein
MSRNSIFREPYTLVFALLLGLCSVLACCKRSNLLTAYSCEPGPMIRTDGISSGGSDPFAEDDKTDQTPFEELQEPWKILRTFPVKKDPDIDQLLDFRRIESSKRTSTVPMSPYRGALVFDDPAGGRPVLVAVKADNQTIRISNTRLKDPTTFIEDFRDLDELCYISNKPLAEKLLLIMRPNKPAKTDGDKPSN